MRLTKLVVAVGFLLGTGWSFAQTKAGDACLSIKAATSRSLTTVFFAAKKGAAVAADAEVQKCIEGKISGGALKDDGITVKVSNGNATFRGQVQGPWPQRRRDPDCQRLRRAEGN